MPTTYKILAVVACLIFIRAAFTPITHRLGPDIGTADDEYDRVGQVVGFHYEVKSWWGFRSKIYDSIRFVKNRGPQYLDEKSQQWYDIPDEAWGERMGDDITMEVDNRGWHEQ